MAIAVQTTRKIAYTTTNVGWQSVGRFTAPANMPCDTDITVHCKDTGTPAFLPFEVRQGTTGGTLGSESTVQKVDSSDPETVLTSFKPYSAQPTNNGNVVDSASVRSDRSWRFARTVTRGGGTFDLWVNTTTAGIPLEVVIRDM